MMRFLFLIVFTLAVFAQEKEDNTDLRNNEIMFSITHQKKSENNIALVRNNQREFVLLYGDGDKQSRLRLSTDKMREVDTQFVQSYFQISLVLEADKSKCEAMYELLLRGDKTIVCKTDEKKIAEVNKLLSYFGGLKQ